jgi:S-layer protein
LFTTDSGADFISSGGGNDVIVAGGGADVITAGAGADKITLFGKTTKLVMAAIADSGANTSTTIQTSQLTSTFDVVYGMAAGTTMKLATNTPTLTKTNNANLSGVDDQVVFARGTFDSAAGTFVYAANGADTAMTYDTTVNFPVAIPPVTGTAFETVILVGYVQGSTTAIDTAGLITFG